MLFSIQLGCGMSRLNGQAKAVLDACLSAESPEVRAKVYQIIDVSGLDPSDPMFLILALTGQMRVLLEAARADLSKLLNDWKEQSIRSLQLLQQALEQVSATRQQEAETLRLNLERVGNSCVEDIKKAGMAATSAIAQANEEVLNQSRETLREAIQLKDSLIALRASVESDRKTNENVLKGLLGRVGQTTTKLDTSIQLLGASHTAIEKIQLRMSFLKEAEWFSPLTALGIAAVVGAMLWAWGMHVYWGSSEKYLPVIKQNLAAFEKCFDEQGLVKIGMDCKIVYHKPKK